MAMLYYFHDPMCSWCYAFDHSLKQVESNLSDSIRVTKILGGLAPDSTETMHESMRIAIQANWRKIENTVPHIKFNFDFWDNNQPMRSTYPACRAVIAATKQSLIFEDEMIQQIQQAYYQNAKNPSLDSTLLNCAQSIGLDCDKFIEEYSSSGIEDELQKQIQVTKLMGVSSFPSLLLDTNGKMLTINIDYNNPQIMLELIQHYIG